VLTHRKRVCRLSNVARFPYKLGAERRAEAFREGGEGGSGEVYWATTWGKGGKEGTKNRSVVLTCRSK